MPSDSRQAPNLSAILARYTSNRNFICGVLALAALLAVVIVVFCLLASLELKGQTQNLSESIEVLLWVFGHLLRHYLGFPELVEWSALAGAAATLACGFGALASLAIIYYDGRITALYNEHVARLNAQAMLLANAKARVQTLWKGSSLSFDKQHWATEEFEQIEAQLVADLGASDEASKIICKAVADWKTATKVLEHSLEQIVIPDKAKN